MISRLAGTLALFLVLCSLGIRAGAQGLPLDPSVQPSITQPLDNSRVVPLGGQIRPEAVARNDDGALPDATPLPHLLLQLKRPLDQEQKVQQLIERLHDPNSPDFHRWLSAAEFGARFGLAVQDIRTITRWLEQQGFQVNAVYPNGTLIDFSATAGQIRAAFQTELHRLRVGSETHFANLTAPQIPAALSGVVAGIVGLHDFKPHRQYHPRINYTASVGNLLIVPADLATIYNLNPLFSAGISGQGQTVVVIEDTDVYSTSDWSTFRSVFGLSGYTGGSLAQIHPAPPSGANNCSDPGRNGDEGEAILDAEWASAAAPSAGILLASCSNTPDGLLIAIQNLVNSATPPPIISVSYGECEAQNTDTAAYNAAYQQAVAEGISVFVASGDWGAAVCDASNAPTPAATHGIGVNALASSPYAVAVGGTDFSDVSNGTSSNYWNATNSATFGSARSYVPEIPWNDSCASTLIARFVSGSSLTYGSSGFCNSATARNDGLINIIGGSGGPSKVFAKPSWQAGFAGLQADGMRGLPDVSLFAGNGVWGHYYVFCWSDPGQSRNGAAACTGAPSSWSGAGGTSFAAPILAAMQALVNQQNGGAQGNPNPVYYALAQSEYGSSGNAGCNASATGGPASSCIFYDVTQGDDDVPCTGSNNCYLPSGTYGVLSTSNGAYAPAFAASAGWDFASGIGTVNANNLVRGWRPFVSVAVSGSGTVTTSPAGINCGTNCGAAFQTGGLVTLTATPASGWVFSMWTGACTGTVLTCAFNVGGPARATAIFVPGVPLSATIKGSGYVQGPGTPLLCGDIYTSCSVLAPAGQAVTLSASADTGWLFTGWGGACSGTSSCQLVVNAPTVVSASFQQYFSLSVAAAGGGAVTGTSTGATNSITCGSVCSAFVFAGQQVTLTAAAAPGWVFAGWTGACSGFGISCTLTMNGAENATAIFASGSVSGSATGAANTWYYHCSNTGFDQLDSAFAGTAPWSWTNAPTASGNQGKPGPGDIILLAGRCLGDVTIRTDGLTITSHDAGTVSPLSSGVPPDGFAGAVHIEGARNVAIENLNFWTDAAGPRSEAGALYIDQGGAAIAAHDYIGVGWNGHGIALSGGAALQLLDSIIAATPNDSSVLLSENSSLTVGAADGSEPSRIENCSCNYGVSLDRTSLLTMYGSVINTVSAKSEIYATGRSAVHLSGTQVIPSVFATSPAIQILGGSSLRLDTLDNGTSTSTNAIASGAILLAGGSSAILYKGTISSASITQATIEAASNSTIQLMGGNTISNTAAGGVALQIDHTSSAMQISAGRLGYPAMLAESFSGSALVDMQSSLDIGLGFLPGTAIPSLTWSMPAGNCLLVRANSAFRMSGGVSFSGAAPSSCAVNDGVVSSTIVIDERSNIFINASQGGTNTMNGGGSIACSFAGLPNAHVTGAKNVSPTMAVTGGWSAGATASSPSCLGP
jgi:hypothetical protein